MAMSVTSKVSTVVLLPAFLLLPMLFGRWRSLLGASALWAGSFLIVGIALYLPMGAVSAVRYMLAFQGKHDVDGHLVNVEGVTYAHPPWWTNLWFTLQGMGTPLVVILLIGVLAAFVVRPGRLVVVLTAAALLLGAFYLGYAQVALPYYYYAWAWLLIMLAAIGYARLAQLKPRTLTASLSVVALAIAGLGAGAVSIGVWQAHLVGIARVPALLRKSAPPGGHVLVASLSPSVYDTYLGQRGTMSDSTAPFSALIVGTDKRFPLTAREQTLLKVDRRDFTIRHVDDLTVWIPDHPIVTQDGALAVQGAATAR
jgi:hypothetical protein